MWAKTRKYKSRIFVGCLDVTSVLPLRGKATPAFWRTFCRYTEQLNWIHWKATLPIGWTWSAGTEKVAGIPQTQSHSLQVFATKNITFDNKDVFASNNLKSIAVLMNNFPCFIYYWTAIVKMCHNLRTLTCLIFGERESPPT